MSAAATSTAERARAKAPTLWQRGFWRWLTIGAILFILYVLYNRTPYYLREQFAPWRPIYRFGCIAWAALGLPYALATVRRFSTRTSDMRDPTIHWMLLARGLWRGRLKHLVRSRRIRTTMLSLLVKVYYAPLMTIFFAGHANSLSRMWAIRKQVPVWNDAGSVTVAAWWSYVHTNVPKLLPNWSDLTAVCAPAWWSIANFRFASDVYYNVLFALDCGWAMMGYCLESQWLKNKTRSVEPTVLGWAAAVAWYPPFNDVTGTYLPWDQSHQFITSPTWQVVCRVLDLAAFTIYAAATVAFGMKFSNLTNRGIITRGPYAFIRHPAYVCKGFAWWMEALPNISIQTAIVLVISNALYGLRAWTEERHLSADPDYLAYKKKVPWALIPGIY